MSSSVWATPKGRQFLHALLGDFGAGANTGPFTSISGMDDQEIIIFLDAAAGAPPVLALEQARDDAGLDVKDLPIADVSILSAVDVNNLVAGEGWNHFDEISRTDPVASLDLSDLSAYDLDFPVDHTQQLMIVLRVHEGALDAYDMNSFSHFRLNFAATAAARQGYACYVAHDKDYTG